MVKINYNLEFPTSVYAATIINGIMYVGGSDWNRRKILYNKSITEKSKGVLYILRKTHNKFEIDKKIFFPSMIYSILPISKKNLFVGCKSEKETFNILDKYGNRIKSRNDKTGRGVYNAIFSRKHKEFFCATRTGKLETIDPKSLEVKSKKQLSLEKHRLWSIDYDAKNDTIYVGDYFGFLYIVHKNRLIKKLNLKEFHSNQKKIDDDFGPSLWGLKVLNNKIITGDRWGALFIFDKNLKLNKRFNINEDITCLENLSKNIILIGTRYGKLFSLNLKDYKISKITEIKPVLQKENAIWGMARLKTSVLVCFADGNVLSIS